MAVSGDMAIDRDTLLGGSDAIVAQRGSETWGANYAFSKEGSQNDALLMAEEIKTLSESSGGGVTPSGVQTFSDGIVIGDDNHNTTIDASGYMEMTGEAKVWDDMRFPVSSLKVGGVKPPAFDQISNDGGGSVGVYALMFDPGDNEQVFFSAQLPHSWDIGTNLHPHVHWTPTDANTGNVVWGFEFNVCSIGSTFGDTTITTNTAAAGGNLKHTLTEFPEVDMSGESGVSVMLLCRVFRDGNNANDTYPSDAALLEVDFHYELNSMGSNSEYSK